MKEVVRLTPADDVQIRAACHLVTVAFGGFEGRLEAYRREVEQCEVLAVLDGGQVAGVASLRPYRQWFAGRELAMTGLGGVAVAAHARRRGVAGTLLAAGLERMRVGGTPVSTLYPSSPPVYRASGWEVAGVVASFELPTIGLPSGLSGEVTLRALDREAPDEADLASVHTLYTAAARDAVGPLTRVGVLFDQTRLTNRDAVVIAAADGVDAGYVTWSRRSHPGGDRLEVQELIADRPSVRDALLGAVGSWQTTIATARIRWGDPIAAAFAAPRGFILKEESWMLRVVDAAEAVAGRGFGPVEGAVDLVLTDQKAPWQEGRWRLAVANGAGTLTRGGSGEVQLHTRGLAALFTGYAGAGSLARAGLADGPPAALRRLSGLFAGPAPWMLDEF